MPVDHKCWTRLRYIVMDTTDAAKFVSADALQFSYTFKPGKYW